MSRYLDEHGAVSAEFVTRLVELAAVWDTRLTDVRVTQYARLLGDYPMPDLLRAFARCAAEVRYFPSPAEILDYLRPKAEEAGVLAWALLERAALRVGAWHDIEIEDGVAARALAAISSWAEFCQLEDSPARAIKRQEFLAAYRTIHRQGLTTPLVLKGALGATVGEAARLLRDGRVQFVDCKEIAAPVHQTLLPEQADDAS